MATTAAPTTRLLQFGLGMTCGVLAALAAHAALGFADWGLAAWNPTDAGAMVRAAFAWWIIAACATAAAAGAGPLMTASRTAGGRAIPRLAGLLGIIVLAAAGRSASGHGLVEQLVSGLLACLLGFIGGGIGAFLTLGWSNTPPPNPAPTDAAFTKR